MQLHFNLRAAFHSHSHALASTALCCKKHRCGQENSIYRCSFIYDCVWIKKKFEKYF